MVEFFIHTKYITKIPYLKRAFANKNYIPTFAAYGASAFLLVVYMTDWPMFTKYMPIYRQKFLEEK